MSTMYYSFVGTLLAFAFRDIVEIIMDLREIKKINRQRVAEDTRNLPKPKTANKSRIQR